MTRDLYPWLADACETRPGVVLASFRYGHHIHYHTRCSVIANNMILTRLQHEKTREADALLEQSPSHIRDEETWIDYVLVTSVSVDGGSRESGTRDASVSRLARELLVPEEELPDGFELLSETTYDTPGYGAVPVARALRIVRP